MIRVLDSFFKGLADAIGDIFANYFVSLNDVMTLAQSAPSDKLWVSIFGIMEGI